METLVAAEQQPKLQENAPQGAQVAAEPELEGSLNNAEAHDSVIEEVEEEEEEGETRCVCGETDPPDGSGLYIQCEQCSVWQHGYCVGIADGEDSRVEKYWCEQCKPELHHLYVEVTTGRIRSIYKPVQEKRRHNRRNNRHAKVPGPPFEGEVDHDESKKDGGQADTIASNSLEEAAHGSSDNGNGVSTSSGDSTSASRPRLSRGSNQGSSKDNINGSAGSGDGGEKLHSDDPRTADDDYFSLDDDKRLQDRRRATFSAREEKQYQLMLEKAIQESRRTSHQEDTDPNAAAIYDESDNLHPKDQNSANGNGNVIVRQDTHSTLTADELLARRSDSELNMANSGTYTESARVSTVNYSSVSPPPNKQISQSRSHSSNSASENDSKRNNSSRRSQRGPKTGRRGKQAGVSKNNDGRTRKNTGINGNDSNNNGTSSGKTDIGINKPMKPRLPPQRTTLGEMRRRVSAILEFISRTQWELSEEHSSKDELVRFVENEQFIEQVDSIFEKYDQSFKLMDDLTRALLLWEKKYSTSPSVN